MQNCLISKVPLPLDISTSFKDHSDLISCEGEIAQVHAFMYWWHQYRKVSGMKLR